MSEEKKEGLFGMLRIALVLTIITLIAAVALAFTHTYTEPFIKQVQEQRLREGLQKVIPEADDFIETSEGNYDVLKSGEKIGEIRTMYVQGYAGEIKLLAGISADGRTLLGIHILEHTETPGLGARATEVNPGEEEPWFQSQFRGLAEDAVRLRKEGGRIDAITAATVTSKTVTDAVHEEMAR